VARPGLPAVRKSDLVVLVLAVLAVTATLVGALSGDRWTDERTVRFAAGSADLPAQGPEDLVASQVDFNWTLPANATSGRFVVDLEFTGQAIRGGAATVTLRVTGPDGKALAPQTASWSIPQGATSSALQVNGTFAWAEAPGTLRDTTSSAHGLSWSRPVVLQVVVQAPGDLPLASYSFSATAQGTVSTYAEA
jgi:hypothetical protein